jgi:hypothetical protein
VVSATTVVLAVCAGMGWLYLLRRAGGLAAGPQIGGALPLQQLAGDADQPLLRVVVAWLPAGILAGASLVALTRLGALARTTLVLGCSAVLLLVTGAISDAAAISDPIASHFGAQFGRAGTWVAVALMVIGSLLAQAGRAARRADPSGR